MLSLVTPFWRNEPFTKNERRLLDLLFLSHHRSTARENVSTVTIINAAAGSKQLDRAIAAAILTLGGRHGPLVQTAEFLSVNHPEELVYDLVARGEKVPGWGGTFQKGPDPLWAEVDEAISLLDPNTWIKMNNVTDALYDEGKKIHPNPSAYTAAVGWFIRLPAELTAYLFIAARLSAWAELASPHL